MLWLSHTEVLSSSCHGALEKALHRRNLEIQQHLPAHLPMAELGILEQAGISHLGEGDIFFAAFPCLEDGISPQEEAGIYKAGHWHFLHCYHPVIQTRSLSRKGQLGLCCSLLLFFLPPFFSP